MDKKKPKLTVDEYYMRPKTAGELMKVASNTKQTVYIYGATGMGKTSFVGNYLARKSYRYFSVSETSPDEICRMAGEMVHTATDKQGAQTIVVLDDLHMIQEREDKNICGQLIEELSGRRDVWLILISRAPIPRWLKSVYVHHIFVMIGKELCFTEEEQEHYLEKWELYPTEMARKRVGILSCGHPLFLRIIALKLKEISDTKEMQDRGGAELCAIEEARKDMWDYLELHVCDQWGLELQEFLEEVSIVEQFDLQMARQITKKKDPGEMILKAQEMGDFLTERRENECVTYEMKDFMKKLLRRRLLEHRSQNFIKELYYSVGNNYEMEGNVTEALKMYEMCHSEEGISRILIENARRNPAAGEYYKLKYYYLKLTEEKIKESIELMAGMCMLQSLLLNEEESERWYQELVNFAKKKTGGVKREAEIKILYLDIALPHRGSLRTMDLLKKAGRLMVESKMVLPEFSVTSNQPSMMNGGKDFCEWSRRDRELAKSLGKLLPLVLGKYGKGVINLALAESLFEKGEDSYEVLSLASNGRMQAESGGKVEQVFVAVGILTQLAIFNNHIDDAREMLEGFRRVAEQEAPKLLPNIKAMSVRMGLYTGEISKAYQWLEEAPDEDVEFIGMERYRYLIKVRVYMAAGRREKALLLLDKLRFFAEKMHRTYIVIEVMMLETIVKYRMGMDDWQEMLQETVTRAEDYHFVRILTREGAALWELLKVADLTWQDQTFKKQVMQECEHMATLYPAYLKEKHEGNVILSDKALKILRLQGEGLSVEAIAEQLGISKAGVKYYNQETYKKLGVNNKAAAVTEARNRRLI
ncbi:MAG: LuxR C-terminal-related transcriptional regulator [Lachnospiraceae bacterium]|nr:LuxR C-terminal-related transcriptional regulator [Lachnospiraceae bacterium]